MKCATAQFIGSKTPVALGRSQKINFHKISITKSIPKIFNQTLCVVSQVNDIKTYNKGFSSSRLGHAPGVGLLGAGGSKIKFSENDHVAYTIKGVDQ